MKDHTTFANKQFQSVETEIALLGSIFFEPAVIDDVFLAVKPEDFYDVKNQTIAQVMWGLHADGTLPDVALIEAELHKQRIVVNADYLMHIADSMPESSHAEHYARIVREKSIRRQVVTVAQEFISKAGNLDIAPGQLLDEAEAHIQAIAANNEQVDVSSLVSAMRKEVRALDSKEPRSRLSTGYGLLNYYIGGLYAGEVVLLAARPSMGKTALAMNIARHIAYGDHHPVYMANLETTKEQLARNALASEARVDGRKLRDGELEDDEQVKLYEVLPRWSDTKFFVSENVRTMSSIQTAVRRLKHKHNVQLVIIDHVQLVQGATGKQYEQMTTISGWLKELAVSMRVAVLALCQLRRIPIEQRVRKPRLDDLKGSGSFEQDADVVLLLHRNDYYEPDDAKHDKGAELIVAKNRNGPVGTIKLSFKKEYLHFGQRAKNGE